MTTLKKPWTVSYTQYSTHAVCPFRYKLRYIDNLGESSSNIYNLFGTSFHEVIQEYLTTMFSNTQKAADALNLEDLLLERMSVNLKLITEKEGSKPCTKEEFKEFYLDGLEILTWFGRRKNRIKYYTKRGWELVGIETPLVADIKNNVKFKAYLDVVLRNKTNKRIKIIDLKTSTKGWGKWAKSDQLKRDQLLLYKKYYAELNKIDPNLIDVEFHIIKRKLHDDVEFQQHHFQKFIPPSGKVSMNKAEKAFDDFVEEVFNEDGSFRTDVVYRKNPGEENRNCRFCEFANEPGLCDQIAG